MKKKTQNLTLPVPVTRILKVLLFKIAGKLRRTPVYKWDLTMIYYLLFW